MGHEIRASSVLNTVFLHSMLQLLVIANVPRSDSCHPDDGGDMFLQNVGYYKSHMTPEDSFLHSNERFGSTRDGEFLNCIANINV
jgi:hypothetical protein